MTAQRILMRAGRPPHDTTSNEAALAWSFTGHFGSNTGNMLFSDAVYTALNLPDTTITCDSYAPEWNEQSPDHIAAYINEHFDVYVLPLANAIRPEFAETSLVHLTDLFKKLTIPVVVVGIGSDSPMGKGASTMPESTRQATSAFIRTVLDRSASIGVRGENTKQVLLDLGFSDNDVDVIGCPSMYINDREFEVTTSSDGIGPDARLATSLEGRFPQIGEFYRANEDRYTDLVTVFQKLEGGDLVLWGQDAPMYAAGTPRFTTDKAYREGRLRFFTNPAPWRDFMRERDFAFGIRIHGNIAALTAGTPAFLISIDSRTDELSDYHAIPRAGYSRFIQGGKYLAEDLYERTNLAEFNRRMPENWDRYHAFLERNGLRHVRQPGNTNPEYAALLQEFAPAPGARPISGDDITGLASRFAWLRQGRDDDHGRAERAFSPEFELNEIISEAPHQSIASLTEQVSELQRQLDALRRPLPRRAISAIKRRLARN